MLLRLAKGGPEQQAIEAGEIDAIIDHASSNVILLPAARRALREIANLASAANREAASQTSIGNSLLASLPRAEYQRLDARLEPVTLTFGEVLHEPGERIRYVYFPIDCVVALLMTVKGRQAVKVALVGHEGMVGSPLALGIYTSFRRATVHGTGTAMRMESARFRKEILQSRPLQEILFRYKHALIGQIAQSAACKQFHPVKKRLARHLLMTGDCARSSKIRLTHEILACALGVQRASVTVAARALRKSKLIKYNRGKITILDRKGLVAASCDCYQIIKRIYDDSVYADC